MLIDYVARYYKFLFLALVFIVFLKMILSYSFHGKLNGMHGILFAIFKWYGQQEQEIEDIESRKIIMRVHNIISFFMYLTILLLILSNVIFRFLPH